MQSAHRDAPVRLGLIGAGIQASKTPAMHMAEARAQGFALDYQLLDLDLPPFGAKGLAALLQEAEAAGYAGLNITHPCKQAVIAHLDGLSDDAAAIGAVNTVLFKDGKRWGHNTDWSGFFESFRSGLGDVALRHVVQIGAGGAGAAVAHACWKLGVERLYLADAAAPRAQALAHSLNARAGREIAHAVQDLDRVMDQADGMINTTPMGMAAHPGLPLAPDLIRPDHWVAEIVYFPLETALLRLARAKGCRVLGGGGMAVHQAVAAFTLFTGCQADATRMQAHFERMIGADRA